MKNKKQAGQSLTEFALIAPLLLFVLMIIVDFGRVLLTYTQTSASVRNALRYGIIVGLNEGSQNYLDCTGIEAAASQALFSSIDSVVVEYETPVSNPTDYANGVSLDCASATDNNIDNGDILVVHVESDISFITPFIPISSIPIDIDGRRTLIKQIDIDTVSSPSDTDNVPLVAITAPDPTPDTFWTDVEGNTINFAAYASDTEDGNITSSIVWYLDGTATGATGATYSTSALTEAGSPYTVQASVTDSDGHTRTTSLDVVILAAGSNNPPILTVSAPSDGQTYNIAPSVDTISFNGTADDPGEDGDLSASILWYVDGNLEHTGASFSMAADTLSTGSHSVFVNVQDSGGLRDQEFLTIHITDPTNTPPTVTISLPDDSSGTPSYDIGDTITFEGTASDTEDGDLTGSILWETSTGTDLGTGGTFDLNASELGVGTHTIYARVADSASATAFDTVDVEVTATYDLILATLNVWVAYEDGGDYTIGRMTGDWTGCACDTDETAVTWNNFHATVSATSHNFSTTASSVGRYKAIEITQLVTDWGDGTYANNGLVIDATSNNNLFGISSREAVGGTRAPYIQVYLSDGTNTYTCSKVVAVADTYIYDRFPGVNYGSSGTTTLYSLTGSHDKRLLIRFDQSDLNAAIASCS